MSDYYWLDGSAYCPDCVECSTPAIDVSDPDVRRGSAVRCSCCGREDGERQYRVALADSNGDWEVLEYFAADDDEAANKHAEAYYPGQEWHVLDAQGRNINGGDQT